MYNPVKHALSHRPINDITAPEMLKRLRDFENRDKHETAVRLREEIGQVFHDAIACGLAENDPTFGLRGALITPNVKHRAAFTEKEDFASLLRKVWHYQGSLESCAGLKLMALLYPRPGELRKASWSEFDLQNAEWSIPAERMKMRRNHKKPLSPTAVEILKYLHCLIGNRKLVFPGYQKPDEKPMSENTLNQALRRMGFTKDQTTAHGFRASSSQTSL